MGRRGMLLRQRPDRPSVVGLRPERVEHVEREGRPARIERHGFRLGRNATVDREVESRAQRVEQARNGRVRHCNRRRHGGIGQHNVWRGLLRWRFAPEGCGFLRG